MIHESLAKGSQLHLNITCNNGCFYSWISQPTFKYMKGQGNVDIVAAVTFAGIPVAKQYIAPVIRNAWNQDHIKTINDITQRGKVTLIGDGRCDSPGHSAKYGTYTLMDSNTGKIVDSTVIAVTEVSLSSSLNLQALKLALTITYRGKICEHLEISPPQMIIDANFEARFCCVRLIVLQIFNKLATLNFRWLIQMQWRKRDFLD